MTVKRLYHPEPLEEGQTVTLTPVASKHVLQVLRMRPLDSLVLFNGQNIEAQAVLVTGGKSAQVEIQKVEPCNRESPFQVHLLQGVSRGERMDYVIQKATELGVTSITPIMSKRCVVKLSEDKIEKRMAHWRSVAMHACEQSGRTKLVDIHRPLPIAQAIAAPFDGLSVLMSTTTAQALPSTRPTACRVLIGPEGGLDDAECSAAIANSFVGIQLGPRIFRTETAPIVILSILGNLFGDL